MGRSRAAGMTLALAWIVVACDGSTSGSMNGGDDRTGVVARHPILGGAGGLAIRPHAVDKVDLLFMIGNSTRMAEKQALLAQAVPDLLTRLVQPRCVDPMGTVLGQSDMNGNCAAGRPEFPPVHDMHIGIVTSSLGGRGGNVCGADDANPANLNLNAHNDDRGELINRGGDDEHAVAFAGAPLNFLTWYPPVPAKEAGTASQPATGPETSLGAPGMSGTLIGDLTDMISGVHEQGCFYEAQNEAWYRFLVQPDPFDGLNGIQINNSRASLVGLDSTILQQRAKFLRPDSLLAVIVLADKDEGVVNPLSLGREGWLYESAPFPGSPTYGAPEGTIECKSDPNDPNCTSCASENIRSAPNFATECPNDPTMGTQGFLDPNDDFVSLRFFNQKQRFGVFPGYPISRYLRGLQRATVPDQADEVDSNGDYVGDQEDFANCVNPIFAQNLPTDPGADLCRLTRGPRTPDLVYYAAIAGVPHQLLQARAGFDAECPTGTLQADCPQKSQLTEADWLLITGKNPDQWDYTGIDPHMLESEDPRSGLPCDVNSNDNCDLINGREWSTNKRDLQFACLLPLTDPTTGQPVSKDCTQMQYEYSCDCASFTGRQNTPLCQKVNGTYTSTQIFSPAFPSIRAMEIAHAMADGPSGVQGIASSVCPIHTSFAGDPGDPLFGYRPAMNAIVDHVRKSFFAQCLPVKLARDPATGTTPCTMLMTLPKMGDESICTIGTLGIGPVDSSLLSRFRPAQESGWEQQGGVNSRLPDPSTLPVCALKELTPQQNPGDFDATGSCLASNEPGWCYVEGQAAGSCAQQIVFTANEPPAGATVNLLCH